MVRRIQVAFDDRDFEKISEIKNDLGLTWEEFILRAADELENSEE